MGGSVTAETLLRELAARGVELVPVGDRLRYRPVEAVDDTLRAEMKRRKPELLALLTAGQTAALADGYRAVLLRLFASTAQGEAADVAEHHRLLHEHDRLVDDLGPRQAEAVYERTKKDYTAQTGRCPLCGGPAHD